MGKGAKCASVLATGATCWAVGGCLVGQPEPRCGGQAGPVGLQSLLLENCYGFGRFSEVTSTLLPTCDEHGPGTSLAPNKYLVSLVFKWTVV